MGRGSSTRRGKFVLSLESLSSLGFEENFAGMSQTPGGVQKVCAKRIRAHFSLPNLEDANLLKLKEFGRLLSVFAKRQSYWAE